MVKRIVFEMIFWIERRWADLFPNRMMPIGKCARRQMCRAKEWTRSYDDVE